MFFTSVKNAKAKFFVFAIVVVTLIATIVSVRVKVSAIDDEEETKRELIMTETGTMQEQLQMAWPEEEYEETLKNEIQSYTAPPPTTHPYTAPPPTTQPYTTPPPTSPKTCDIAGSDTIMSEPVCIIN